MVRKGIAGGYCRAVPWTDTDAFRRHFELRLAMDCEEPFTYTLWSRYRTNTKRGKAIFIDVATRCRKCTACRDRKAMYWAGRAVSEYNRWPSTYMVTLTLRPEMHYHFDAVMHSQFPELAEEIKAFDRGLAAATLFQRRAQVIGREVTLYTKRLRKRAPLRTLIVAEAHAESGSAVAGRPHFHLLLHEKENGTLINPTEWRMETGWCSRCARNHTSEGEVCDHAFVRHQWPHGFTKVVRCVNEKSVFYLCKYMSKAMATRVRASQGYGCHDDNLAGSGLEPAMNGVKGIEDNLTPPGS